MKRIKKCTEAMLCIAVSVALLFMDMEMLVFAVEYSSQTESELAQEISGEDITECDNTKTGETETVEVQTRTEETAQEERTADTMTEHGEVPMPTEEIAAEEVLSEAASTETVLTEGVLEDNETEERMAETEAEVEESMQKVAFSNTDIAHGEYKENGNDLIWVIDQKGTLIVEGTGDFEEDNKRYRPWLSYIDSSYDYGKRAESIKSAVIRVKGMTDAKNMFRGCENLTSVDLSGFDTSKATDMSSMFEDCRNLTSVDLSGFDTSKVTDMSSMFSCCNSLTNLNLSSFDTSNVTDMSYMFGFCSGLTSLDLNGFDTSKVTDMNHIFSGCSGLTSLDISSFDTSNVADMGCMFDRCGNLPSLNLSGFNTSRTIEMDGMFMDCNGLISLELSGFNTSQVSDMSQMFENCSSLTSLDLRSFNTGKVTNMCYMFYNCSSLTSLELSGFNTSQVSDMRQMFGCCSSLTSLELSSFNTSQVSEMNGMFYNCSGLTSLDLSSFNTSRVAYMDGMFYNCSGLASLDLSSFNTSRVAYMDGMFRNCSRLTSLDLSSFNTSNVIDMGNMFYDCGGLTNVNVHSFDTSNVINMENMFYDCGSLISLDLSSFDISDMTNMENMFYNCSSLTSLDLSNFNTGNITSMENVFYNCSSLTSLDLSSFDTSRVTSMSGMFGCCSSLTSLDLSSFDTTRVADMGFMFNGCSSLTSLDLSSFDTSGVDYMGSMFNGCSSLTSLDLSSFDTNRVTSVGSMFNGCSSLTGLDLSGFDMGNVTITTDFFKDCSTLVKIYTPRNLKEDLPLTGTWYDINSITYTSIPTGQSNSVLIHKDVTPEYPTAYITARKAETFYACGKALNISDIIVMYYGADGTTRMLLESDYTTNAAQINMDMSGEKTLTIFYTPDGVEENVESLTTEIKLTVGYLLNDADVTVTLPSKDAYNYVYDKKAKKPVPVVVYHADGTSVTLTENMDYTVSYRNNKNACQNTAEAKTVEDAPTVIIRGCGFYTGIVEQIFEIQKAAAPDPEEMTIKFSASDSGGIGLSHKFAQYGTKTKYVAGTPIEDSAVEGNVLEEEPSISSNLLWCQTNGTAGDFVTVPVTVSFQNYEDSVLYVKVVIRGSSAAARKRVKISGIEIGNSVYNKTQVSYAGTVNVVLEEDNTDLTNLVNLVYTYSGTQADGSVYAATQNAPINAGTYKLTVAVAEDDQTYTGTKQYPFTIEKASLTLTARDMGLKIGGQIPDAADYQYDTAGLFEGDKLTVEPILVCNITDSANAGDYEITISGADAGMNYEITYKNGTLTVSETGESASYYTVTFSLSGKGSDIINTGVKGGSFLEMPQNPQADGNIFTGWYKDKDCTVLWDFAKDVVQADTTIYAGWAVDGDDDDSSYEIGERIDLDSSSVSAEIAKLKDHVYDQNAYEPVVKVTAIDMQSKKRITLTEGADYRVIYQCNINASTEKNKGKVIVKGNGIYKGQIEKTFTITQKPINKLKVITGAITGTVTDADLSSLPVYVYDGTKCLQYGTDYTFSDPKTVKTSVQVMVKAVETGNYSGSTVAKLTVYENGTKVINSENIMPIEAESYTGKAVEPVPKVTVNGNRLVVNKDYKVQYQNNKNAGTAYVIVTGKGEYKGKAVVPFTIKTETIDKPNDFTIKEISDKTFNGKLQKPSVSISIIKNGKAKKLSRKDYTVTYKNNFHEGEATVIVTGKGNYAGLGAEKTFIIKPQQMKKASLKGTQGNLTLTYNKRNLKEGTDYETPIYGTPDKNKVEVTIKGKGDFTGEIKKKIKTQ